MAQIASHQDCITVDVFAVCAVGAFEQLLHCQARVRHYVSACFETRTVSSVGMLDNHRILITWSMRHVEVGPRHIADRVALSQLQRRVSYIQCISSHFNATNLIRFGVSIVERATRITANQLEPCKARRGKLDLTQKVSI